MWDKKIAGTSSQLRRVQGRVPLETLCSEVVDDEERYGLIVDLSEKGLRVQRPLGVGVRKRVVQLEFELPEADEIVWAKGEICFDQLWRVPAGPAAPGRLIRTSGIRLVAAASRHLRLLRDYVVETRERLAAAQPAQLDRRGASRDQGGRFESGGWLMRAAGYQAG